MTDDRINKLVIETLQEDARDTLGSMLRHACGDKIGIGDIVYDAVLLAALNRVLQYYGADQLVIPAWVPITEVA